MAKKKDTAQLDLTATKVETQEAPAVKVESTAKPASAVAVQDKPKPRQQLATPAAMNNVAAAAGLLGLIERLASSPEADIGKMQALLDMQERIMNKNSEIAFNRDFDALSQVLPRIEKKGGVAYENKQTGKMEEAFTYAKFEDIDEQIRPLIHKYGFSISHTSRSREGGGIVSVSTLSHREGHSKTCELPLALDSGGGKNNLQALHSSTSYGRRIGTVVLLNLITIGSDTNGEPEAEFITTEQAAALDLRLRALSDWAEYAPKFLTYMKAASVPEIVADDLAKADTALTAKEKSNAALAKKLAEQKGGA